MIFVEITKLLSFSSATIFKKRMPFAAFACLRKAFTLLELVVYILLNRVQRRARQNRLTQSCSDSLHCLMSFV